MSDSGTTDVPKQIRERFGYLLAVVHTLLMDFIVWNDISRYPDLPADTPGSNRAATVKRNRINEFQLRHLYIPTEKAIILGLFVLLYEKTSDFPTLRTLSNRLFDPKIFALSPDSKKRFLDSTLKSFVIRSRRDFPRSYRRSISITILTPFVSNRTAARSPGNGWIFCFCYPADSASSSKSTANSTMPTAKLPIRNATPPWWLKIGTFVCLDTRSTALAASNFLQAIPGPSSNHS
jgi:hypothetical protein